MITKVLIKNYKKFRDLEFYPTEGMNIIVGDNETGKSTLLEVINLVLCGRINGYRLAEELNPYWFNADAVKEFFEKVESGQKPNPPKIEMEVYFDKNSEPQRLRGKNNLLNEDCPGIRVVIELDDEFVCEFGTYLEDDHLSLIPTEYYLVRWLGFDGEPLHSRPKELKLCCIDARTVRSTRGIDNHTRQLLSDYVERDEGVAISIALRKAKKLITEETLTAVNERIKELPNINRELGLEVDQSSSSRWEYSITPQISGIPFAMAGQGQQVIMKIALALQSKNEKVNYVLIEEPENHLSHTSLTKVIGMIEKLTAGKQSFVATHSSYVLNRLGLNRLQLLGPSGTVTRFDELTEETVRYFKRCSGYDTLRVVLAQKLVIVEGPSDEMIFCRAYEDKYNVLPVYAGIDIVPYSIQNRRVLELCQRLDRAAAAVRDSDNHPPDYWKDLGKDFLLQGRREMFIGEENLGRTLETQLISANKGNEENLIAATCCPKGKDLLEYMLAHKTEVALNIATSSVKINYPVYINQAIEFLELL